MRKFISFRVLCSSAFALLSVLSYGLYAQSVQVTQENGLYGLKIGDKVVLQNKYQNVEALKDGKNYYSFSLNKKVGLVSLSKQAIVAEPVYDEVVEFKNRPGYVSVTKANKEGVLRDRDIVVPCAYDSIYNIDGFVGWDVYQKGKAGYYIDKVHNIPCVYPEALEYYDWYSVKNAQGNLQMVGAIVAKNANGSLDIYRDGDAKLVLKGNLAVFDAVSFQGSLLVLHKGKKVGFATREGKIIQPNYDHLVARGSDAFAFLQQIDYNQGVLYVYNAAGKLLGKHNIDASRPMSLRRILSDYGLVMSL